MTAVFHEYGTSNAWVLVNGNHSTEARVYPKGTCGNAKMRTVKTDAIHYRTDNVVSMHMNIDGNSVNNLSVTVDLNLETLRLAAELLGYSLKKME